MTTHAVSPTARTNDLVLTESGDELIVYDLQRHVLHCMEPQAARVWRACDGTRTAADVATELGESRDTVDAILRTLAEALLLENAPSTESPSRASRRKLLKSAGIGAAVISVTAPSAAAQASSTCVPFNQCAQASWGNACCDTGLICAYDMRDSSFACFAPVFCDDPDFWQVTCWPN